MGKTSGAGAKGPNPNEFLYARHVICSLFAQPLTVELQTEADASSGEPFKCLVELGLPPEDDLTAQQFIQIRQLVRELFATYGYPVFVVISDGTRYFFLTADQKAVGYTLPGRSVSFYTPGGRFAASDCELRDLEPNAETGDASCNDETSGDDEQLGAG